MGCPEGCSVPSSPPAAGHHLRDLKLENVLLLRGHIVLTDFGLSKEFRQREVSEGWSQPPEPRLQLHAWLCIPGRVQLASPSGSSHCSDSHKVQQVLLWAVGQGVGLGVKMGPLLFPEERTFSATAFHISTWPLKSSAASETHGKVVGREWCG